MFGNNQKNVEDVPATSKNPEATVLLISENSVVNGNISTNEVTNIQGTIEGTITVENDFSLGNRGIVRGPIFCQKAFIEGAINGNLTCKSSVVLKSTAKVTGDVQCTSIVIEKGAYFCGNVVCTEVAQ